MDSKRTFLLTVAYNGGAYTGFQYQDNGLSIQGVLEEKLGFILKEPIRVRGASRTDSGVHAKGQRAQFQTSNLGLPTEKVQIVLNRLLPPDISVIKTELVGPEFRCSYDSKRKTYTYHILNQEAQDPFQSPFVWHVRKKLDLDAMREAASYLVGTHDFASFRASGYQSKTSTRTLYQAEWHQNGNQLSFTISGNGFLYRMVRNIVGTLVDIGRKRYSPAEIKEIMEACNREFAGVTAPPQGLCLDEILF